MSRTTRTKAARAQDEIDRCAAAKRLRLLKAQLAVEWREGPTEATNAVALIQETEYWQPRRARRQRKPNYARET